MRRKIFEDNWKREDTFPKDTFHGEKCVVLLLQAIQRKINDKHIFLVVSAEEETIAMSRSCFTTFSTFLLNTHLRLNASSKRQTRKKILPIR